MNAFNHKKSFFIVFLLLSLSGVTFAQKGKSTGRDSIQRAKVEQQKIIDRALYRQAQEWRQKYERMTPAERHDFLLKYDTEYRISNRYGALGEDFGFNNTQRSMSKRALFAGVMTGQFHESYLAQMLDRKEPHAVWRALMEYLVARAPKEPVGHHVHTEPRCSNWWRTTCTDVAVSPEMLCMIENWPSYRFTPEKEASWIAFVKKETERLRIPLRRPGVRERLNPTPLPSGLPCNVIMARAGL
jgi:hypothetical protein